MNMLQKNGGCALARNFTQPTTKYDKKAEPMQLQTNAELIQGMLAGGASTFEITMALRMLLIATAIIGEAFAEETVQNAWASAMPYTH